MYMYIYIHICMHTHTHVHMDAFISGPQGTHIHGPYTTYIAPEGCYYDYCGDVESRYTCIFICVQTYMHID